jgi:hypothetical protein
LTAVLLRNYQAHVAKTIKTLGILATMLQNCQIFVARHVAFLSKSMLRFSAVAMLQKPTPY